MPSTEGGYAHARDHQCRVADTAPVPVYWLLDLSTGTGSTPWLDARSARLTGFGWLVTSLAAYFMDSYNIVIDSGMITNILQTDRNESMNAMLEIDAG